MSWKSFVSAGLLCVLASPAFAQPTLSVSILGDSSVALNANGDWVWRIKIGPSGTAAALAGGSPLAAELGFRETSAAELLSAAPLNPVTNFDTSNPGQDIFGAVRDANNDWEATADVDPGAGVNIKPSGLQVNTATDEVFAALGSVSYTTVGPHDFINIIVDGPVATSASSAAALRTTTLQWGGTYDAAGAIGALGLSGRGRISEATGATTSANYHLASYAGSLSRTATPGDSNLTGGVSLSDLAVVLDNLGSGTVWQTGNFKGTATTSLTDLATVLDSLGQPSGGGGSGGGSAVPEPATAALMGLGILSILGLASRKRK